MSVFAFCKGLLATIQQLWSHHLYLCLYNALNHKVWYSNQLGTAMFYQLFTVHWLSVKMGGIILTSRIGFWIPALKLSREIGFTVGTIWSFRFDFPSLRENVILCNFAGGEVCIFGWVGGAGGEGWLEHEAVCPAHLLVSRLHLATKHELQPQLYGRFYSKCDQIRQNGYKRIFLATPLQAGLESEPACKGTNLAILSVSTASHF